MLPPPGVQQSQGIFVVPAEGGAPIQVYEGAAISPAWSADGESFYFASSRATSQDSMNLWRLPFDPRGDVRRHHVSGTDVK